MVSPLVLCGKRRLWCQRARVGTTRRGPLAAQPPDDQADHERDENARGQRKIKREPFAPDEDVTRQAAKTQFAQPGPQQADRHEDQADDDQRFLHDASVTLQPSLESCPRNWFASTTDSAVMFTRRRTVAVGVRICTGLAEPRSIGPTVTPSPPLTLSRLNAMLAASRLGMMSRLASPLSSDSGNVLWRMVSDSAASPCISPSTSSSGASAAISSRARRIF